MVSSCALRGYIEGEVLESAPILDLVDGRVDAHSDTVNWVKLARAKVAGQKGDFETVVSLCEELCGDQEVGFHAGYLTGFAQMKLKKYHAAASILDAALAAKGNSVPAALLKKVEEVAQKCREKAGDGAMIFKFPRTHHIFDAGGSGVTRDDLVLDAADQASYLQRQIFVEEKIDGANLGIWLDDDYTIRCQNRAHFVTCESGAQWKGLQQWMDDHAATLCKLLEPRKHILFGEWMYAKHSIEYDQLPSYFVAFDLYDIAQKKFFSRRRLYQLLAGTDIAIVPMIHHGVVESLEQFRMMLDTPSLFKRDGSPVEGVYIRVDDDEGTWLTRRCKLVRPDFIQGIETHWMLQNLVKNKVDIEFSYHYADKVSECCDRLSDAGAQLAAGVDVADTADSLPSATPSNPTAAASCHSDPEKDDEVAGAARGNSKRGGSRQAESESKLAARVVMLCGLPGSGKSTLSTRLAAQSQEVMWTRVNQDEHGRSQVQDAVHTWCKHRFQDAKQRLVLDMCNMEAAQRAKWLQNLREWQPALFKKGVGKSSSVMALHLDVAPEECKARLRTRQDHPTIKGDGCRIVDAFAKTMAPPSLEEGFGQVVSVRSTEEIDVVLKRLM